MSSLRWGPYPRKTIYKGGQKKWYPRRKWALKGFVTPSVPRNLASSTDLQAYDADITVASAVTYTYQSIFTPVPGTGYNTRLGDRTVAKFLRYNLVLIPGTAMDETQTFIRLIIGYDYQPNGANPTSPMPMTNTDTTAMPNPDFRYRFKILRDFIITVHQPDNAAVGVNNSNNTNFIQRGYIRLPDLITQYIGTAGTVADIASGAFFIGIIGDLAAGASHNATLEGTTRIIYAN